MKYSDDYAAAKVPMMPVVYGARETTRQILLYSLLLFAMCLALFSVARLGFIYLGSAIVLNGIFIAMGVALYRDPSATRAWSLFRFSILYLALLFGAIAVDVLVG
jgi:protoheme IX farnesyltransferase